MKQVVENYTRRSTTADTAMLEIANIDSSRSYKVIDFGKNQFKRSHVTSY